MATRIIFAGTPDFAVPCLSALAGSGHPVVAVYTQPDRPAGRGRALTASPVKRAAQDLGLPVLQPQTLRDAAAREALRALQADLLVVVAYGLLLPERILAAPHLGCINVHASLLPRWRGAAPIQRAILAGDTETGITIMRMEKGLDTGPMYLTRALPIAARETGGSLHDRLRTLGAEALMASLPGILDGSLVPQAQDDAKAVYAHKLSKAEASIDWSCAAAVIDRQVRAFDPWPVAETRLDGDTLRVWAAEPIAASAPTGPTPPGTIVGTSKSGIDVATGEGLLRITRLQLPGKRPVAAGDLLNARSIAGQTLG
jgi:methionyl-tRNA formyltransferase